MFIRSTRPPRIRSIRQFREIAGEGHARILPQPQRHLGREKPHALACEIVAHIAHRASGDPWKKTFLVNIALRRNEAKEEMDEPFSGPPHRHRTIAVQATDGRFRDIGVN